MAVDHRGEFLNRIERSWVAPILRQYGFTKRRRRGVHASAARSLIVQIDTETKRELVPSTVVRIDWGIFTPRYAEAGWPGSEHSPDVVISIVREPVVAYGGEEVTWILWPNHIERLDWGGVPDVTADRYIDEVQEHLERVVNSYIPGPRSELELYEDLLESARAGHIVLNPTAQGDPLRILEHLARHPRADPGPRSPGSR